MESIGPCSCCWLTTGISNSVRQSSDHLESPQSKIYFIIEWNVFIFITQYYQVALVLVPKIVLLESFGQFVSMVF